MLRRNKGKLILSSLVTLLPAFVGLLLWDRLPQQMITHWNAAGQPDGWSDKGIAILLLPLILLAVHWLCLVVTAKDPKNAGQTPKAFRLVIWIIPTLSVMLMGFTYFIALGQVFSALRLMNLLFGLLFLVMGNYMPKFRQNYTVGIKIRWTLRSEENWNATHRFAGKVWFLCGLAILICAFLPWDFTIGVLLAAIIPAVALPILYSWIFHRKQVREGTAPEPAPLTGYEKTGRKVSSIAVPVILVLVAALMFTGNIRTECTADALTITATYHKDATVGYDQIDTLEYRPEGVPGTRMMGFSSARLLLGSFQNEEFGLYTRYTYTGCHSAIVITSGENVLVLSGKDDAATQALYEALLERTAK